MNALGFWNFIGFGPKKNEGETGDERSKIGILPEEILDYIFDYIPAFADQCASSSVCRKWKRIFLAKISKSLGEIKNSEKIFHANLMLTMRKIRKLIENEKFYLYFYLYNNDFYLDSSKTIYQKTLYTSEGLERTYHFKIDTKGLVKKVDSIQKIAERNQRLILHMHFRKPSKNPIWADIHKPFTFYIEVMEETTLMQRKMINMLKKTLDNAATKFQGNNGGLIAFVGSGDYSDEVTDEFSLLGASSVPILE